MLLQIFAVVRGIFYACLFVWLWGWLALVVRAYDSSLPVEIPKIVRPVGIAIAIAGALLGATCIAVFAIRGRGTPAPFDAPREFVATGPYRFVRNPMYIGAMSVIAGFGLIARSPAILLLAVAFFLITHVFVVVYEEPALTQEFGTAYRNYKARVHRWLPSIPSDSKKQG